MRNVFLVFFFKQKTAYEMRISDWSSDVCSSDLQGGAALQEYVDAGARALDVRPRSPAAHRLAQCEIREGARSRGGERRGAQRGARLWRDRRTRGSAQAAS